MNGYVGLNLKEMIEQLGEDETKQILSEFSCPQNKDVEYFLKNNAITFSKQGISSTYIIMASFRNKYVLVGYFTLANKIFCIEKNSFPSQSWRRRIAKFAQYDTTIKRYTLSAPLIGQLGKNFANSYNTLISGDELLKLALDKVQEMQNIVGGKIVYLECEDKECLLDFYSNNGFVNFGKRMLDRDETDTLSGEYLIQMLKYMK
ncbi:MAG: N-acetyltransferase [Bacillota bacterium]|nr:N-acetyltransferase [Bacillota bacterium]